SGRWILRSLPPCPVGRYAPLVPRGKVPVPRGRRERPGSTILRPMPAGELIFANVLDLRQRAAEGEVAEGLVYLLSLPARALPFAVIRDWKAPTGYLEEEVQLVAPSGKVMYRIGPAARYLVGSMDLTRFEDVVEDAVFEEAGIYLASFLLAGEVLGQTEFQVVLQAAPEKLPKEVDDGLKKSDVAWIGVEYEG